MDNFARPESLDWIDNDQFDLGTLYANAHGLCAAFEKDIEAEIKVHQSGWVNRVDASDWDKRQLVDANMSQNMSQNNPNKFTGTEFGNGWTQQR